MEIINPEKLLLKVVSILDSLKINYFITGGYAVSVWGRPRSTADIDIVVELIEPSVNLLLRALRKISKAGYIDEDVAREAVRKREEFNFIEPETGLKVDFWVSKKDQRAKTEYKNKIAKKINNKKIYFISPEDLIISKLVWYSETMSDRHLEDVESIMKISKIDLDYLKKQAEQLNVLDVLNSILDK